MIKNIAIVSLSRGVAGEAFAQHEVRIDVIDPRHAAAPIAIRPRPRL